MGLVQANSQDLIEGEDLYLKSGRDGFYLIGKYKRKSEDGRHIFALRAVPAHPDDLVVYRSEKVYAESFYSKISRKKPRIISLDRPYLIKNFKHRKEIFVNQSNGKISLIWHDADKKGSFPLFGTPEFDPNWAPEFIRKYHISHREEIKASLDKQEEIIIALRNRLEMRGRKFSEDRSHQIEVSYFKGMIEVAKILEIDCSSYSWINN